MTTPSDADELHNLCATEMAALIRDRSVSSVELVQACLDQIARLDDDVRAWRTIDPQRAIKTARERDKAPVRGPLHGVPLGIKDVVATAAFPTEYGSEIYRGHRPAIDAACVTRAHVAGAIVLGKTVTTEFATAHPAETRNPHDLAFTPGGSSSGSAAAVAARMVPAAIGTQTVGSTIRPASFCGVLGFKPTLGLVNLRGVRRTSGRNDTIGLFARDPRDLGLLLGALVDSPLAMASGQRERVRVARADTPWWARADADSRRAVNVAHEILAERGIDVATIELPSTFDALPDAQDTIVLAEMAESFKREYDDHRRLLSTTLRHHIEQGRGVTVETYDNALAAVRSARQGLTDIFADCDALLVPAVTGEAPRGRTTTGDPVFCRAWTVLGTPACSVPVLLGSHQLPVGVQIVGPPGSDQVVLAVSETLADAAKAETQGSRPGG